MKSKKSKQLKKSVAKTPALSNLKKRLFWGITLVLPILFFLLLEIILRIVNFGGNLDLFIEGPPGYEEYLRCNPNVARRYFSLESRIPTLPLQLFLKQKPENGYRIFVMGESSAAGFPYGNNVSFPNILEHALTNAFPEKNIEVINISMAAINSYTLLDLVGEILTQKPDAVLVYTGHNEYYGALGVGSVQSLGNWHWLINTYLELQKFKTFILLRDIVSWIRIKISNFFNDKNEVDLSATLMERIVAEQTIPYRSALYEIGKNQFKENTEAIISKCVKNGVKVVLSEIVSNIRDQKPFISINNPKEESADSIYSLARYLESNEKFEEAKYNYLKAKDLDALRFRAPEEFNIILKELSNKFHIPLVPVVSYFEKESPHGLIGNSLILEHLHPSKEGYFLVAKAFYETLQNNSLISTKWPSDCISQEKNMGVTALDSVYASLVVMQLKSSWPFQPRSLTNLFEKNYKPSNLLEEIAFRAIKTPNYNLESGHMELGEYYEREGNFQAALAEYNALITSIPQEIDFYKKTATLLISQKEYDKAYDLLLKSLKYKENPFAYKWIGQIALMNKDYKNAISYLQKADLLDDQVVFNLSRAYYFDNQWNKGEEYFSRLQNLAPKSEYVLYLNKLRSQKK